MKKVILGIILMAFLAAGCATIMNGDMVNVPVYTSPSGAKVIVNGTTYNSPATVMIPRGKGDFKLHIEKEGYQPVDILLTQSPDGWIWGNVIFGGLIGLAVDFITGDAYDLEPEVVTQDLQGARLSKSDDGSLQFVLVDIQQLPENIVERIKQNSKVKS